MKIPLQEKIAELEQRIVRLEERDDKRKTILVSRRYANGNGGFFGPHWRKIWEEFHLAMKEMFE